MSFLPIRTNTISPTVWHYVIHIPPSSLRHTCQSSSRHTWPPSCPLCMPLHPYVIQPRKRGNWFIRTCSSKMKVRKNWNMWTELPTAHGILNPPFKLKEVEWRISMPWFFSPQLEIPSWFISTAAPSPRPGVLAIVTLVHSQHLAQEQRT